jgi:serine/threonine-protein kinase PpkA
MQIPGYRIIRKINQGGMSTVYLAIQISVGRVVALKVMSPALNGDPVFSERFQREANIVGQLSHPNIVSIYDIGRHDELNYIAMDYLPGGSAHDRMMGGLTAEEALRVAREIASALDHAHEKGYIHRDIKPENILFRADNSAVLSDFGVAKGVMGVSRMTNVGQVVGTPHYMSPEQTRGRPVDARSDLYSLGIVLYEMFTGSVPFQGDAAVTIAIKHLSAPIPKLPSHYQAYQKIIDKLLAKDPDQRFQRGREVVAALESLETAIRHPNAATTQPTDLSTIALLKALVATTGDALRRQIKKPFRLRWTPERGLYQRPDVQVTQILVRSNEEELETAFATSVQGASHFRSLLSHRQQRAARGAIGVLFLGLIWCAFSVVLESADPSSTQTDGFRGLTRATAQVFLSLPAPAVAHPSSSQHLNIQAATNNNTAPESIMLAAEASDTTPEQSVGEDRVSTASKTLAEQITESFAFGPQEIPQEVTPELPTYSLVVDTIPSNARVRIMNIVERYHPGILLTPGRYLIEVSHPGFETLTEWVEIIDQNFQPSYSLQRAIPPSQNFVSNLTGNKRGPEMVRIPIGTFVMGDKNASITMPVHNVTIGKPFAISKYEITFDEYELFAKATDRALPDDSRWGRKNRPVINVSWNDAQAYVAWLSKMSGETYRLPSESEWEYMARAGSRTVYWWGDYDKDAMDRANCRRGCFSKFSGLFASKTAPAGHYIANDFGIYDTAGNAAEWVQDCYSASYGPKPKNGRAYEKSGCKERVVRGGSAKSNVTDLASHVRDHYSPITTDPSIGFRVVMELD